LKGHTRFWVLTAALVGVVFAVLAGVALLAWPQARLGSADDALARVVLPGVAGRVVTVDVHSADGTRVPVQLRQGRLWPLRKLACGERLTVLLTVRRPDWAGWLVGHSELRRFTIVTPSAHLLAHWLQVKAGKPVTVAFDTPVSLVSLAGKRPQQLVIPRKVVPLGLVASGLHSAGAIEVAAAARTWESLPAPEWVSWFPEQPYPQLMTEPRPGTTDLLRLGLSGARYAPPAAFAGDTWSLAAARRAHARFSARQARLWLRRECACRLASSRPSRRSSR